MEATELLGKTIRLTHPAKGEESARYLVVEDNGDRLLAKLICDLPIPPVELMRRSDVTVADCSRV
jgi:hypothetical protein